MTLVIESLVLKGMLPIVAVVVAVSSMMLVREH